MSSQPPSGTFSDYVWSIFVSVKFTVVLLILWVIGSVAGTLILQNPTPVQAVELYGTSLANLFLRTGLFDVYHSTWYTLILLLLMLAILACSLNTLKAKTAMSVEGPKSRNVRGSGKRFLSFAITHAKDDEAFTSLENALKTRFKDIEVFEKDGQKRLYAQKQPWSHFMVYVVHAGFVIIILGGLVSAMFGFEGVMEIPQGESRDFVFKKTTTGHVMAPVPFEVRLDDFELQRFPNGMPKDYFSDLSVIVDGTVVQEKRIEVNTPMMHGAYNFYQSSYIEQAPLVVSDAQGARKQTVALRPGEQEILETLGVRVAVEQFFSGMDGVMQAVVLIGAPDGQVYRAVVGTDNERNRQLQSDMPFHVSFNGTKPSYITGLMVVADPGVGFIWFGSFLLMLGLYLTFYSSHRQLAAWMENGELHLRGYALRNTTAYKRELERVLADAGLHPETKA